MSTWISVLTDTALENNQRQLVEINDTEIIIFRENDQWFAIENRCTHDGGDIFEGTCENGEIVCARHGARFCLRTGMVKAPPAYEDIRSFSIRVYQGDIQINIGVE